MFNRHIFITGLALFAMFFGAGNLIFPVMMGINAGTSVGWALLGFCLTGIALPAIALVAATSASDSNPMSIVMRLGRIPGQGILWIIFLTTGMLYAVPRVATVSFEIAVAPVAGVQTGKSSWQLFVYAVIFFIVVAAFSMKPGKLVDRVGAWLTPTLLVLITLLVIAILWTLPTTHNAPSEEYANAPLAAGLVQGYFTMDAMASYVFGFIIVSSLRRAGYTSRPRLFGAIIATGCVTGVLLGLVYSGLGFAGNRLANGGFENGAQALAFASRDLFGSLGHLIFGLIAILACLTTAVGLFGASTPFYRLYFPKVPYSVMLLGQSLVAIGLAYMGLDAILAIVSPLSQFIYPLVICLVVVTFIDMAVPGRLFWSYRLTAGVCASLSLGEALLSTKLEIFKGLGAYLNILPGGPIQMSWFAPTLIALLVALLIDAGQGRFAKSAHVEDEYGEVVEKITQATQSDVKA
ncbi:branched-chain amino acid transport system II carrier protein [Actinotignum urinale]|uniref:branched-chain amino acid transport system II carrier protein n=1 Tax=Actinotignum urinale TaxID=190146 RepID=UPI0003B760E9|nr:branched-chain amino acid transport system II carrier protein [Actinotignum urinale]MDY5160764.1 branched-chain amino acid transport system II carrier protein [Actinotignum urinale]